VFLDHALRPDDLSDERWTQLDESLLTGWLVGRPPHTERAYRADIARFRAWAGKPLCRVTPADIKGFAGGLGHLAPATRYRILASVKSLLAYGNKIGYLRVDAGLGFRLAPMRPNLRARILPEADLQRMLSLEPNPRNRAILALLYASGLRVRELCGLSLGDLEPRGDGGQIRISGKTGEIRFIPVPSAVWKLLTDLHAPATDDRARPASWAANAGDPVFRSRNGKQGGRLRPLAVRRMVRQAARRAGIELPVSPKWMRHAHAAHALDHGAPLPLVQATLGHASIATTARYLQGRPKDSSGRFLAL
jgi:integrase/recombinase XerD